jgi:hypothetical protein
MRRAENQKIRRAEVEKPGSWQVKAGKDTYQPACGNGAATFNL